MLAGIRAWSQICPHGLYSSMVPSFLHNSWSFTLILTYDGISSNLQGQVETPRSRASAHQKEDLIPSTQHVDRGGPDEEADLASGPQESPSHKLFSSQSPEA